ncbi:unnamed protein product [Cyprideis torosa]|uniref:Uncharacterized protein n=1 Tax=Cyprideis torosa TaxID=163714 RepID=A0A7R8WH01_9CRUS|nr:unnamed protein product [Cyprideis torosa]CAG0898814.1 unnamed protein product [Cyprideis torosa]
MDNKNQTSVASDQIEVSGDEGTVRKGKNSRGHCKQKKRFTCGVCGKSLSTKRNLQSHEFTHTLDKPFACNTYAFRSKSGLHYHQKKHSEGIQSVCALCDQPFRLVEDLEKHLK